jgi:unsaturated rhamnogalacturonyl hydrolase
MRLLIIISIICTLSCSSKKSIYQSQEINNLSATANKIVDHLIQSPKYMLYQTPHLNAIHYAEVCAAYGAIQYLQISQQDVILDKVIDRYTNLTGDSLARQTHHVDGNVYGILPFSIYRVNKDKSYLDHGLYMADTQWTHTFPNGMTNQARYWLDDVYMVGALQMEAYLATNKYIYLDRAAKFTVNYLDSLQEVSGLFHHGPNAPIFWGRGNGWMAVGLAQVLKTLPTSHRDFNKVKIGYTKMMAALIKYQSPNGLWRQVIDNDSAWEESSCTAMFLYAMSIGLNKKILNKDIFQKVLDKGLVGLNNLIDEQGRLKEVSAGTGQSTDENYYLNRPRILGDFHGQAPMLWLINSLLSK